MRAPITPVRASRSGRNPQPKLATSLVGQDALVHRMLIGCDRAHLLIEGVPGLAKTTAVGQFGQVAPDSSSNDCEFTPRPVACEF